MRDFFIFILHLGNLPENFKQYKVNENRIIELIENGKLEKAIKEVKNLTDDKNLLDELTVALFQLKEISREFRIGQRSNEDILKGENKNCITNLRYHQRK